MVGTSDVISGGGGGCDYVRTAKETYRTMSSSRTDLTTAAYNNASSAPYILKSTNKTGQARDRMPDGAAPNDYWHVECDVHSYPYVLEETTALTNGRRNIIAVLLPGAKGFFQWDGTEWLWHGNECVHWWDYPLNVPQIADVTVTDSWQRTGMISCDDEGILILGASNNATRQLQAKYIPIDSNGVVGTPGTHDTFTGGNATYNGDMMFARQVAADIWIAQWWEQTSNDVNLIPITKTLTNTLTISNTEAVLHAGGNNSKYRTIVPIRAQAASATPAFLVVSTVTTGVDAAHGPEIFYCTIAGTGASAVITVNTGVTFAGTGANTSAGYIACIEDPDNDGVFWMLGSDDDGTTNTEGMLTRFTIVGTTPTLGEQYEIPFASARSTAESISFDPKDNNVAMYFGSTGWEAMFTLGTGAPKLLSAAQTSLAAKAGNYQHYLNPSCNVQFGGVRLGGISDTDSAMTHYWSPRSYFGATGNASAKDNPSYQQPLIALEAYYPIGAGDLSTFTSAVFTHGTAAYTKRTSSQFALSTLEDEGIIYTIEWSAALTHVLISVSQIPTATRYRGW